MWAFRVVQSSLLFFQETKDTAPRTDKTPVIDSPVTVCGRCSAVCPKLEIQPHAKAQALRWSSLCGALCAPKLLSALWSLEQASRTALEQVRGIQEADRGCLERG